MQRLMDAEGFPARGQVGQFEKSLSGLTSQIISEVDQQQKKGTSLHTSA